MKVKLLLPTIITTLSMLLVTIAIMSNRSGDPLRDALMYPDCEQACLWGIEPGVSNRTDVRQILNRLNIDSVETRGGADLGQANFTGPLDHDLAASSYFKFISPKNSIHINTWNDSEDNIVMWVDIPTINLSITDVIHSLGNPSRIIGKSSDGYVMVYEPLSTLVFVTDGSQNYQVAQISLYTQRIIIDVYMDPAETPSVDPCADDVRLCYLATAIPNPDFQSNTD